VVGEASIFHSPDPPALSRIISIRRGTGMMQSSKSSTNPCAPTAYVTPTRSRGRTVVGKAPILYSPDPPALSRILSTRRGTGMMQSSRLSTNPRAPTAALNQPTTGAGLGIDGVHPQPARTRPYRPPLLTKNSVAGRFGSAIHLGCHIVIDCRKRQIGVQGHALPTD